MNLEQLKIFLVVAEHKSFTKAAESMYISHSTTSRNVASLEEYLGVRLLDRDNRSVKLTPAGQILFREGTKLLKKVDSIEESVKNAGRGISGKISVASVNLYSKALYNGYQHFCRMYPEVVFGLYHKDIPDIWNQVISRKADIGVTFSYALPADLSEMELQVISTERFCVVTSVEHPLALRKSVKSEDLRKVGYISLPSVDFKFTDFGVSPSFHSSGVAVVPTIESLFLKVRSGNGISLVPYPIAYEYGANCAILELEDMETSFDVVMIWQKDNLNPSLPLLIDTMMSHIKKD